MWIDAVPELLLNLTSSTETNIAKNSVGSSIKLELKEALVDVGTTESAKMSGKVKHISTGPNENNDDGSFSKKDIVREEHSSSCSTPKTFKKRAILGSVIGKKDWTPVAARSHGIATNLLKR